MDEILQSYLLKGEGVDLEFKRCGNMPESDVYETICSFANREGGHVLLGVEDDGTIAAIDERRMLQIKRMIINATNNPNLFNIAPALEFFEREADGKSVLDVWVPMGPGVYYFKGKVYDRISDVDVHLVGESQLAALYIRKKNIYTEQQIYPFATIKDLDTNTIKHAKELIRRRKPDHPWLDLSTKEFLRAARLWTTDLLTGEEGLNLAALMLLGKDETIASVSPVYRTDALVLADNTKRYSERLCVTSNLVTAYTELCDFCKRWLPDSFALDGDQRVSARDILIRELISNTLIHREFSSPYISTLTIEPDVLQTKNASRCLFAVQINPSTVSPVPKNPIIANFFVQLGFAEELGSGTKNLYKYSELYTGKPPYLEDNNFFIARVPIPEYSLSAQRTAPTHSEGPIANERVDTILDLLSEDEGMGVKEIADKLSMSVRSIRRYVSLLVDKQLVVSEKNGRTIRYKRAG